MLDWLISAPGDQLTPGPLVCTEDDGGQAERTGTYGHR